MGSRLFTAVLPPDEVLDQFDTLLEPRRDIGAADWRWTPRSGWHLTTAFMADVPGPLVEPLVELLVDAAATTSPFDLRLEGARCFPDAARARLLAVDVAGGHDELAALARRCRNAASRAGADPDGARFQGHLTLGRARRPFDATRWVHVVDSFGGWTFRATELVLVESHLAERRYEVLERFPLGQREGREQTAD